MSTHESYAEFILGVFRAQLVDCARWYPELTKEFNRDYQRLSSAIDSHGIRFALDTMPAFRKHLDKCLAEQRLTPSGLLHFGVARKGEVIPRLFRGLTSRVFDRNGMLKSQPDTAAIKLLRQLLGVVRKLRLSAGTKDVGNAVREFYQTDMGVTSGTLPWHDSETFDQELIHNDSSYSDVIRADEAQADDLFADRTPNPTHGLRQLLASVQRVADLFASELGEFIPHEWVFKHGPGAVADQPYGTYKYVFRRWPDRLEHVFPHADFALANFGMVEFMSVEEARAGGFTHEPPARMCAVPKTIKTPRLIACEPVSLQWCQQAVLDFFYSRTRKTSLGRFVSFTDQSKNGRLALEASHHRSHSTIDLSAASDRVSCWHVERLFRRSPSILRALQATRSVWIRQDICKISPEFHKLRKYSTMGNATTFPVQSIFFAALGVASVLHARGLAVNFKNIRGLGEWQVRVFGDDIIVPSDASAVLVGLLKTLSLKVNDSKTFTEGNFRESCGVDAYAGDDVTSVSILEVPRTTSPNSIVSTVDVHNNFISEGMWATASYLRKAASFPNFRKIREVEHGGGAFGWWTYGPPSYEGLRTRVNKGLQVRQVQCLMPKAKAKRLPTEGYPGLLQFFTEAAKKVTSAKSTLGHLAQRPKCGLALGWATV